MNVVVISAWNRSDPGDTALVPALLEKLQNQYKDTLRIITTGCDRGVGKLVRQYCMPEGKIPVIDFVEFWLRIYNREPADQGTLATIFASRDMALYELGDEFHLFTGMNEQKGVIGQLVRKVRESGRPVAIYKPGHVNGPQVAIPFSGK